MRVVNIERHPTVDIQSRYLILTKEAVNRLLLVSCSNWVVAIFIPFVFWTKVDKSGYPWYAHYIFIAFAVFTAFYELYFVFRNGGFSIFRRRLTYKCCGCWSISFGILLVPFHLILGALSRADTYTDATFIAVAWNYREESPLWIPSLVIFVGGVFFGQYLFFGYVIIAWLHLVLEEEDERAQFIAMYGQLMLFAERIKFGNDDEMEAIERTLLSIPRFCCEDLPQTIIQILFLVTVEIKGANRALILSSIIIAFILSLIRTTRALLVYCSI